MPLRSWCRVVLIGATIAGAAGCSSSEGHEPAPGGSSIPADAIDAARQACVDRINAYRATEGKPPYERWLEGEACADEQARIDAQQNEGHASFGRCDERAQNTCLRRRDLDSIVGDCLQTMWDEGPGSFPEHGHYLNMASTQYSRVACGFFELEDGRVWANQNFH